MSDNTKKYLVYSKTINSYTAKLRALTREILRNEVGIDVRKTRFEYQKYLYPIQIVLFEDPTILGFFDSKKLYIGIHKKFILEPLEKVNNLLRHEIAHYLAFIKYGDQIKAHGPEFKSLCRLYNWGDEVSAAREKHDGETITNSKDKQLERIKKLFSLSSSDNNHEAEQATLKANQLLTKYNLEHLDSHPISQEELTYSLVVLSEKRMGPKLNAIYELLQEFFVIPVFNRSKGLVALEVVGSKRNVDLADYIAKFLNNELEEMWKKAKRLNKLSGPNAKSSYFDGVALGFIQKMRLSKASLETSKKDLILLKTNLLEKFELAHPRIGNAGGLQRKQNNEAKNLGKAHGKSLSIKQALNRDQSRKLLM